MIHHDKYYIAWFRFKQQDGYMLWIEQPDVEFLWTDAENRVPAFRKKKQVIELAQHLGYKLEHEDPLLNNLDSVFSWIANIAKEPPRESLDARHLFDDLSKGVGKLFIGNRHGPVFTRVFDLLYLTGGPWSSPGPAIWPRQERKVLRRILQQGFRLWDKHVYWSETVSAIRGLS